MILLADCIQLNIVKTEIKIFLNQSKALITFDDQWLLSRIIYC